MEQDFLALAQRLAQAEPAAFAELYDRLAARLHRYLLLELGCVAAAEDVLQETFVRLAKARGWADRADDLTAYVFGAARNEAQRYRSRQRRMLPREQSQLEESPAGERIENIELAVGALARLSAEQREVVELKIYAGLTFREIAAVLAIPSGTVATRYRAALEVMRAWLTKEVT